MKLSEIQDLIKFVAKSGVNEVELEHGEFKLVIKTNSSTKKRGQANAAQEPAAYIPQAVPVQQMAPPPAVPPVTAPATIEAGKTDEVTSKENSKYITIKSPMIGTFYRRPSPDKPLFVNVGDDIAEGHVVCIIEAMKLFNEIEAESAGKIVKILVEDNSPVEYDQPLFLVDPS